MEVFLSVQGKVRMYHKPILPSKKGQGCQKPLKVRDDHTYAKNVCVVQKICVMNGEMNRKNNQVKFKGVINDGATMKKKHGAIDDFYKTILITRKIIAF